jgi:hypothetical protein
MVEAKENLDKSAPSYREWNEKKFLLDRRRVDYNLG